MRVLLQRDFSVEGMFFKRDGSGTEIPDEINGRKVVLFKNWDRESNEIPLPNEATMFDPANPGKNDQTVLIKKNAPDVPIALSQLPVPPSPEEMLAKKAK